MILTLLRINVPRLLLELITIVRLGGQLALGGGGRCEFTREPNESNIRR